MTGQPLPKNDFAASPFTKCWEMENNSIKSFASDNKFILLSETNGNILQINSQDRSQMWVSSIGNRFSSDLYLVNGSYFVLSQNTGESPQILFIRKINRTTGITEWSNEINLENNYHTFINEKLNKLIIISQDLYMLSIDLETGKTNWEKHYTGNLKKISETNDKTILLLTTDNNFMKIDFSDGSLIDRKKYTEKTLTTFTTQKDLIIGGDSLGNVYGFQNNKPLPKKLFRTGGEITYIGTIDTYFYVISNDNFIYLYSSERNKLIWKKRLPGCISIKPIIQNNIIIVTTVAAPDIYFLEVNEGNLINRIELQNNYLIKDVQQNQGDILILTNKGLIKFGENCSK